VPAKIRFPYNYKANKKNVVRSFSWYLW